jgi:hypothetical protein
MNEFCFWGLREKRRILGVIWELFSSQDVVLDQIDLFNNWTISVALIKCEVSRRGKTSCLDHQIDLW